MKFKTKSVSASAEQAKYIIDLHGIISFLLPTNDAESAQRSALIKERDRVIAQLVHDIGQDDS